MSWQIRFPKKIASEAESRSKHLLAIGFQCRIHAECFMFMDEDQIFILWFMAHGLASGKTPEEALASALKKTRNRESGESNA